MNDKTYTGLPATACSEDNIDAYGGYRNITDLISAARAMHSYKGACEKGLTELNRVRAQVTSLMATLNQIRDCAIAMDDSSRSYKAPTVILAEGGRRIKDWCNAAIEEARK